MKKIVFVLAPLLLAACTFSDTSQSAEKMSQIEDKLDFVAELAIREKYDHIADIATDNLYTAHEAVGCNGLPTFWDVSSKFIVELRDSAKELGYTKSVNEIDELTQLLINVFNAKCGSAVLQWSVSSGV